MATVADTFTRTTSNGWGTADTGGAWTHQSTIGDYSTDGTTGAISIGAAGAERHSLLASTEWQDQDITWRFKADKTAAGGNTSFYAFLRRESIATADYYRMTGVINSTTQAMTLLFEKLGANAGAVGSAVSTGLTFTADTWFWVRAQAVGVSPTALRAKAWADGSGEPGTWQLDVSDSTATSLQVATAAAGVGYRLSSAATNAPVVFNTDDLTSPATAQEIPPDADVTTTGWSTTPLWSKLSDDSDATVITATLA